MGFYALKHRSSYHNICFINLSPLAWGTSRDYILSHLPSVKYLTFLSINEAYVMCNFFGFLGIMFCFLCCLLLAWKTLEKNNFLSGICPLQFCIKCSVYCICRQIFLTFSNIFLLSRSCQETHMLGEHSILV